MPTANQSAGRTVDFLTANCFAPLIPPHRYKGAFGGRGGAKSQFFADLLIKRCLVRKTRAVCVREIQRTLEMSVKQLIEDKLDALDLKPYFSVYNNRIEAPRDGLIIFTGMQDHTAHSIKSLEGFDVAWVEEAQSLSERSLTLLRPTIREPQSELWFSWNPKSADDPVDQFFRGGVPPPDSALVRSSYEDNPWFPNELRMDMEWDRARDPDKYAHVWLGEYERRSEARVFKNWRIDEFEPSETTMFYYGGDWGYSIDPAVLVRCYSVGKTLYIDREAYKIGCEIDHLPDLFDTVPGARDWIVVADSARPETISYMQRHGFPRMEACKKGKDSVKEGVIFLQGYDIVVHPRCKHTIDELTMYSYKVDKQTGNVTPILEDKKNHVIDSLRYATEKLRQPEVRLTW